MDISGQRTYLADLITQYGLPALAERLRPKTGNQPAHVPGRADISLDAVESRWAFLGADDSVKAQLLDDWSIEHMPCLCSKYRAFYRDGEGAHWPGRTTSREWPVRARRLLRAGSDQRGEHGGFLQPRRNSADRVGWRKRGPPQRRCHPSADVRVRHLHDLGTFVEWALAHLEDIEAVANATTRFGKLQDIELSIEGTKVYFQFIYSTGDAAGQNMVTIATYAAVEWIVKESPVRPRIAYLEGNFSGDKKASALSFERVRGKKVVAEATLPAELVKRWLHVDPAQLVECARIGTVGAVMSGTLGTQAHFANGLAGLFLACGQDVACVSEAAVGITDMELTAIPAISMPASRCPT